MFTAKKTSSPGADAGEAARAPADDQEKTASSDTSSAHPSALAPNQGARPSGNQSAGSQRRIGELVGLPARSSTGGLLAEGETVRLGPGVRLKGELSGCGTLMIEGEAEVTAEKIRRLVITESGRAQGSVLAEEAEIAGHFSGTLFVARRLSIRATGRIDGTVRCGELEVAPGGRLMGTLLPAE